MGIAETTSKLRTFLEQTFPHPANQQLSDSTNLLEDWFLDSLGIVQTVVFLEGEYGVDVKPADINVDNFRTIDTLTAYISRQLESH